MIQETTKTSRGSQLSGWLKKSFSLASIEIHPLKNDASFRQYYRCTINDCSYVVMDAPPDKENIYPFIEVTKIFRQAGVLVPELVAYDLDQGFLVLSDLGDTLLLDLIENPNSGLLTPEVALWYQIAMDNLICIQASSNIGNYIVPFFDTEHIKLELSYFSKWFLGELLNLSLTAQQSDIINKVTKVITQGALSQPQVIIHRDFHSRNLMILPGTELALGIIDYQDAMIGPITYDLVSLLKDCYVVWPKKQVEIWLKAYYKQACALQLLSEVSYSEFKYHFELMGLQRHLKVLGVFSRLNIRDRKPRYLDDIPRIIQYVLEVTSTYPELSEVHELFIQKIIPAFEQFQAVRGVPTCA